jgi:hypothetical protein
MVSLGGMKYVARFIRHQWRFACQMREQFVEAGQMTRTWSLLHMVSRFSVHIVRCLMWIRAGSYGKRTVATGPQCTAVVLSYSRPANINWIVESLLACDFVSRVVVSNNNPEYDINDWIRRRDPRVFLLNQARPTKQGIRFALARSVDSPYYFLIDDDVFLYPSQLGVLFEHLVADPAVPHGLFGERRAEANERHPPNYPFRIAVRRQEAEVDHITQVYALSHEVLRDAFVLLRHLEIDALEEFANGEDIVLSFAGKRKPRIHDVGRILQCRSMALRGIATFVSTDKFFEERTRLHETLARYRGERVASDFQS